MSPTTTWPYIKFSFKLIFARAALPFTLLICLGLLVGVLPIIQIKATSGLVNHLIAQDHPRHSYQTFDTIKSYLPWLGLLIFVQILRSLNQVLAPFFGTVMREILTKELNGMLWRKMLALKLEHFDDAAMHTVIHNAYRGVQAMVTDIEAVTGPSLMWTSPNKTDT